MASFWTDPKTGRTRASVRLKGHKPASRYFTSDAEARAWATDTEKGLRGAARTAQGKPLTVSRCVDTYREMRAAAGRPIVSDSNLHYMLRHLAEDFGDTPIGELVPSKFVEWAKLRHEQGAGGYTIYMELQALGTMLANVAAYLNIMLPDVIKPARKLLYNLQMIESTANARDRRVLPGELEALCEALPHYRDLLTVAVRVGLRRGEITRIVWTDLDEVNQAVLVRKRKNPRATRAKDQWVPLLFGTWEIVKRQPRTDARIFPVHPQTLTKAVTDTARELGIPDLHLHDLRHEANSAMRDAGFDEIERMAVLGHTRAAVNARYTHATLPSLHAKAAAVQGKPPGRPRRRKDPAPQTAATGTRRAGGGS